MNKYEQFVRVAYAGLVVRGYDKLSEIDDPILREIWKMGRRLVKPNKAAKSREGSGQ